MFLPMITTSEYIFFLRSLSSAFGFLRSILNSLMGRFGRMALTVASRRLSAFFRDMLSVGVRHRLSAVARGHEKQGDTIIQNAAGCIC